MVRLIDVVDDGDDQSSGSRGDDNQREKPGQTQDHPIKPRNRIAEKRSTFCQDIPGLAVTIAIRTKNRLKVDGDQGGLLGDSSLYPVRVRSEMRGRLRLLLMTRTTDECQAQTAPDQKRKK